MKEDAAAAAADHAGAGDAAARARRPPPTTPGARGPGGGHAAERERAASGAADLEARLRAARDEIASLAGDATRRRGREARRTARSRRQLKGVAAQERRCRELQSLVDEVRTGLAELQADMTSRMPLPRLHRLVAQLLLRLGAAPPGDNAVRALATIVSRSEYKKRIAARGAAAARRRRRRPRRPRWRPRPSACGRAATTRSARSTREAAAAGGAGGRARRKAAAQGRGGRGAAITETQARAAGAAPEDLGDDVVQATSALHREQLATEARDLSRTILADVAARDGLEAAAATGGSRFAKEKLQAFVAELAAKRMRLRAIGWQVPLFDAAGACDANMEHRAYDLEHQRDILQEKVLALQVRSRDDAKAAETAVARVRRVLKIAEAEKESEFLKRVEAEGALGCVEINQCVGAPDDPSPSLSRR